MSIILRRSESCCDDNRAVNDAVGNNNGDGTLYFSLTLGPIFTSSVRAMCVVMYNKL